MLLSDKVSICFDDVLGIPQYSDISSRDEINLEIKAKGIHAMVPIVSAPMDTIAGVDFLAVMARRGGLGIIHRYQTTDSAQYEFEAVKAVLNDETSLSRIGVAIASSGDFLERAQALYDVGCRFFCVDVAHGHHVSTRYALEVLRNTFGTNVHLMAGNVATLGAFNDLADWGADSIRVGIGGGCFAAGTEVITADGPKPIGQIEIGDIVYTHKNRLRKVTNTFVHEEKNQFVVVNGIKSTPNHEYYVLHKSHIEHVNDDNIHELAEWVPAEHLSKDYVLLEIK
jgi:IMP dehydrogenase/GMP reductase